MDSKQLLPYVKVFFKGFLIFLVAYVLILAFIFPYQDLANLVSSTISQQSRGQMNLQFNEMSFSPLPSVSAGFTDAILDIRGVTQVKADSLAFSVSPFSLLSVASALPSEAESQDDFLKTLAENLSASIEAEGLYGGSVELSLYRGAKAKEGHSLQSIELDIQQLSIEEILRSLSVPFDLKKGELNLRSEVDWDPLWTEQPIGDFKVTVNNLVLPDSIETPAGPLTLPVIRISQTEINGDIKDGIIAFKEIKIGQKNDKIKGTIDGTLALQIVKSGSRILTNFGAYNLNIQLEIESELHSEAELLFLLVGKYKQQEEKLVRYAFRVQGTSFQSQPRFSDIRR